MHGMKNRATMASVASPPMAPMGEFPHAGAGVVHVVDAIGLRGFWTVSA